MRAVKGGGVAEARWSGGQFNDLVGYLCFFALY